MPMPFPPNPFWPTQTSYPQLSGTRKADIVVVGGGIAGCSSAAHLRAHGYDVVLLEQARVCFGATGSSSGILYFGSGTDFQTAIKRFGEKNAQLLWDETKKSIDAIHKSIEKNAIDCGLRKPGTIILARNAAEEKILEGELLAMKTLGYPGTLLSGKELAGIYSAKEFRAGLRQDFCSQIKPGLFAAELLKLHDTPVFEDSPMKELVETKQGVVVKTPGGQIEAQKVVVASNISPFFGLEKNFKPESSTIIPSAPAEETLGEFWHEDSIFWTPDEEYDLFYQHDGRAFFEVYRLKGAKDKIASYFPPNMRFEFAKQWGSVWAKTADWLPIVGNVRENIVSAIGVGDQGIVIGFTAGRKIVRAVEGKKDPLLEMFSPARFARLMG